jgi:predicted methyltransferase
MPGRTRRWIAIALVALAGIVVLAAAASFPYLPLIHGTTADEVERLASWLEVRPGMRVADLGAGDGTYAVALARRVGPSGQVYATELGADRLADIRWAATEAGLSNVAVIEGAVSRTNLPDACCDALFSRLVYHHLTDPAAINADILRALRPGGHMLIIDFEPGGIMNWIGRPETATRHGGHGTPKGTVVRDVTAAGFQLVRGPEAWRGRIYGVLFRRPWRSRRQRRCADAERLPAVAACACGERFRGPADARKRAVLSRPCLLEAPERHARPAAARPGNRPCECRRRTHRQHEPPDRGKRAFWRAGIVCILLSAFLWVAITMVAQ